MSLRFYHVAFFVCLLVTILLLWRRANCPLETQAQLFSLSQKVKCRPPHLSEFIRPTFRSVLKIDVGAAFGSFWNPDPNSFIVNFDTEKTAIEQTENEVVIPNAVLDTNCDHAIFHNEVAGCNTLQQPQDFIDREAFYQFADEICKTNGGVNNNKVASFVCSRNFTKRGTIQTLRLDDVIDVLNPLVREIFLKIDAQGSELEVLRSLGDYVHKVKFVKAECQQLECSHRYLHYYNNCCQKLIDYLIMFGFKFDRFEMGNCGVAEGELYMVKQ